MNQLFPGYGTMTPDPTFNLQLQNLQNQIARMQPNTQVVAQAKQLNRVKGRSDVEKAIMAPNSTDSFFQEDDDIMFIKSTDTNNQAIIRRFRFYEEEEAKPQYITVDDLRKFKSELLEEMRNGQQPVRRSNEPAVKLYGDECDPAE